MLTQIVSSAFHLFQSLGSAGVFVSMLVENIGVPLPTEIGYLIAQELISTGKHSWTFMIVVLTLGHTTGALISYSVGRWGDGIVKSDMQKSNKNVQELHVKLQGWYDKYGNITIFGTRFIGYVRPWSSYIAGFSGVAFWPFFIWTLLGSLIFNIMTLYFTGALIVIWRRYEVYHFLISAIGFFLFFGFLFYVLYKYLRDRKKS